MIKTEGNEVVLYSKDGSKVMGRFPFGKGAKYKDATTAESAAKKREQSVRAFKHMKVSEAGAKKKVAPPDEEEDMEPEDTEEPEEEPETEEPEEDVEPEEPEEEEEVPPKKKKSKQVMPEQDVDDEPLEDDNPPEGSGEELLDEEPTFMGEALSLGERERLVSDAFRKQFGPTPMMIAAGSGIEPLESPYCREIYDDFVLASIGSTKYRVDYEMDDAQNITFQPRNEWQKAEMDVVTVESEKGGRPSHALLAEHFSSMWVPLEEKMEADMVLIEPGIGNKRDRHYYSADLLRGPGIRLFEGAKMYTTNHDEGEHNVRNWVATIQEVGKRYTKEGAPIARIAVHREDFWRDLKNLQDHGLLHTMHNSILAVGKARPGKVNGEPVNVVESIEAVKSVDFVPRAGAGGHVMTLVEKFVNEGDLDLLTFDVLVERRPDLIERVRKEEKGKLYGRITQLQESEVSVKSKLDTLQEEMKAMANENHELEARLAEVEEENEALLTENDGLYQANMKAQAVAALLEREEVKVLPPAVIQRVIQTINEGWFDPEVKVDLAEVVGALLDEEIEYLKEVAPTGQVRGLGESYEEDPAPVQTTTLEERQAKVDEILVREGVIPARDKKE